MLGSAFQDGDPAFWEIERTNLRRRFDALVRQRIQAREIARLDVFALAPQPLLVELGRLLGDIVAVDVRSSTASRKAGHGRRRAGPSSSALLAQSGPRGRPRLCSR